MDNVKEGLTISAGLTAPAWMLVLNEWIGCCIGLATLVYICAKIYVLLRKTGGHNDF